MSTESVAVPRPANGPVRLNQPWRAFVAVGEIVVAVAAVIVGIACWRHGVTTLITPLGNGQPPLRSTIFYGNWMASGIGLVTVAALLVLDAIREVLLARAHDALPPGAGGAHRAAPAGAAVAVLSGNSQGSRSFPSWLPRRILPGGRGCPDEGAADGGTHDAARRRGRSEHP